MALGGLLQQLEAAQGGVDSEARSKMDLLRQQLGALDQARQRAASAEADAPPSSIGSGAAGLQPGAASSTAGAIAGDDVATLQQMEGLSARLSGLECKLAQLDDDSRAVLLQAGGTWLGALQADGDDGGRSGSSTAAEEGGGEEAAAAAEKQVAATGADKAAPQPE